jgi:hypothetical protein
MVESAISILTGSRLAGERYDDEYVSSAMMTRATMEAGINVCRCIGG